MSEAVDQNYYRLLHELQAVDFVLVELNLYLDTHPNDEDAIEQFKTYALQRRTLRNRYEAEYGPLCPFEVPRSSQQWEWINTPWPWQV